MCVDVKSYPNTTYMMTQHGWPISIKESGLGLQMRVDQNQHVKTAIKKSKSIIIKCQKTDQKKRTEIINTPII